MNQTATATRPANPNVIQPQQQQQVATVAQMQPPAQLKFADDIESRTDQFRSALPAHIPVERFKRILITAVSMNPDLLAADRRTFFNSAMKAATDGLLPDGRDGALVIYKTKMKFDGQEKWVSAVQWMPMVAGIRKKVRNSGEIADLYAEVVYGKDEFDYQLGLNRNLHHKPAFLLPLKDRGPIIAAYSVAKFKSGESSFDVMSVDEIWDVWRKSSKQKDKDGNATGMWRDHQPEAFKKTVVRRHSKQLPMSTDIDDLLRRDDDLYDFKGSGDSNVKSLPTATPRRPQIGDFSTPEAAEIPPHNEDGEILDETQSPAAAAQGDAKPEGEAVATSDPSGDAPDEIYNNGWFAFADGAPLMAPPDGYTADEITRWKTGWQDAEKDKKNRAKA